MIKHFNINVGDSGKFYVSGMMGSNFLVIPLTDKSLAKKVEYNLNNQLRTYEKQIEKRMPSVIGK